MRRATFSASTLALYSPFLSTLSLRRATNYSGKQHHPPHNFYPRSPCGERRYRLRHSTSNWHFYPRSPCGERPTTAASNIIPRIISIHALLAESDVTVLGIQHRTGISIHALLAESDDNVSAPNRPAEKFLSTLSLRRATSKPKPGKVREVISIHALLAESDGSLYAICYIGVDISIHALLAESDNTQQRHFPKHPQFLSTLSLRRATELLHPSCTAKIHFYPRSPCGERPLIVLFDFPVVPVISIHALLAESDLIPHMARLMELLFLSTLSLRRATNINSSVNTADQISIHALLAESDLVLVSMICLPLDFYPRSPCGERLKLFAKRLSDALFLSTLSLRRATSHLSKFNTSQRVFLSTLSLRRATPKPPKKYQSRVISIHALLAESDSTIMLYNPSLLIFLSTLSLRRATSHLSKFNTSQRVFLSTLSLRRATLTV